MEDGTETDEEVDSKSPMLDRFCEQGDSAAIPKMANFDPALFLGICCGYDGMIMARYNISCCQKSVHTEKDMLFMTPCVKKHWVH